MTSPTYPQRPFALPDGATEVVLIRHGASQPHDPAAEPFPVIEGGHADPPLAPEGERQAQQVGARLSREGLAALFVTPLQRTAQTAAPLAAATGLTPAVVPELREVHLGAWEGGELRVRFAHRDPLALEVMARERWDVIPGAEAPEAISTRVAAGLAAVVAAAGPDVTVAAVVHGGIVGELCRQATASRPFAFVQADNASISRLVVLADGRLLLRSFNDISHLAP